jgi:uncharacterized membrane protein
MKALIPTREIDGGSPTRGGLQLSARLSNGRLMPLWLIPMLYTVASVTAGLILPRMEHMYLADYAENIAVGSALAFFSSVSSGMMALTGIVFAIAFVLVQFNAIAYSPRLVVLFAGSPRLFHTLGIFFATFFYSLAATVWTDRGGSGRVPLFSTLLVAILLIVSMVAFARLVQSLNDLQIHNVLQVIGARGRSVIRVMFPLIADSADTSPEETQLPLVLGPVIQTLTHSGEPRVITRFDLDALVRLAQNADAVVAIECGVGDTLVEGAVLLRVHGTGRKLPEQALRQAIHVGTSRTFEKDPKYAIRLLVDIAIRALSPAVNDPTTAVQALDQIEDLLRRLGRRQLDAGLARDSDGTIRVTFPTPTWQDYLSLSFDEIRQYGATSIQVGRRLRAALVGLSGTIAVGDRRAAVQEYLDHLNLGIGRSSFDDQDRAAALQEDRQGLGLSRRPTASESLPIEPQKVHSVPES